MTAPIRVDLLLLIPLGTVTFTAVAVWGLRRPGYRGRPFEPLALTKRAILQSPLYDSAPLAGFEATADWLKTVSMGESMSWTAECAVTFGSPAAKIPRG